MSRIEHIILNTGDEGVTLNNAVLLEADPSAGDSTAAIKTVAKNLANAMSVAFDEIRMEAPYGREWNWDQVIELRIAAQAVAFEQAQQVIATRGISVGVSDMDGFYFHFDRDETGLPELDLGDSVSMDFDTEEEAVMAAYQWVISVDAIRQNAPEEESADAPRA